MISLDPISPNYYEKKIKNKITLRIFRFFQLLNTFILILIIIGSLGIFYFPDKILKKYKRKGFIVSRHKGLSEVKIKGAFKRIDYHNFM